MDHTRQERIVLDFISAYRDGWPPDLEAALSPLAADACYQIVVPTVPPVHGRDKILAAHQLMKSKVAHQRHELKSFGSRGDIVFMERVDYSERDGKWSPIPLAAVFELDHTGQIIAWREYLDLANAARQHGLPAEELLRSLILPD